MISILFIVFRDKERQGIYALFLFFVSLLFFVLFLFHEYYTYQIDEILGKKEANRGIVIENADLNVEQKMRETKEITSYAPLYFDIKVSDTKNRKVSANIYKQDELLIGTEPKDENDVVISKFYYNILGLKENDMQEKKEMQVYMDGQKVRLNMVGVTSNNQIQLYMQENLFIKLNNSNPAKYYAVIDEYKNVDKVINKFLQSGYFSELKDATGSFEIEKIRTTQKTFVYIFIGCIFLLFLILFSIIKNIFYAEGKNISILKAIGYPTYKIYFLHFFQIMLLVGFSILFLLFTYGIVYFILYVNHFQIVAFLSSISILKILWIEYIVFLLALLISTFGSIHKIKNRNILKVLNDE